MLPLSPKKQLKGTVNRLGWALVIMLGTMGVVAILEIAIVSFLDFLKMRGALDYRTSFAIQTIVETLCYLSYFFVPAIVFYFMSKNKSYHPIKFRIRFSKHLPLMIFSGLAITQVAAILNSWFDQLIGYELPVDEVQQYVTDPVAVAMFMTISLAPAFAEEVLFRGVVYTNLRPFGKTFAVLGSALTFAFMHQNVGQFFYTMVAGVVMALIYEATGSIWGSVFLHMFNNLYAVLQSIVLFRYSETTATVILTLAQTVILLIGAVCTVGLIWIQKNQLPNDEEHSKELGVFATDASQVSNTEIPFSQAFSSFFEAKGMRVYLIIAASFAVLAVLVL